MKFRWLPRHFGPVIAVVPVAIAAAFAVPAGAAPPDFEQAIAPLLARNCVTCHNASDPAGHLDLSQPTGLLTGGDSGPALVLGDAAASYLVQRVRDGSMPPEGKGSRLAAADAELLADWVTAGATWPAERTLSPFEYSTERRAGYDWWSLLPVARPWPPGVVDAAWPRGAIDRFVLAALEAPGLSPAPEADRATYIRRATLDLTGLPPSPEEIEAFLADDTADAHARLVDRLLASPHYGERWGRHWLDVGRFGESDGFENDKLREHSWPYRDYVIRSFNQDKPYPQFIQEQLAGDALTPITHDGLAATGFLVAGSWDEIQNVGASKLERLRAREEQMEELVAAVSQTFLGMTVNCARCHDHKFDPIPQTDYYRLKAVFDGVDHGNRPLLIPAEQAAHDAAVEALRSKIAAVESELAALGNFAPGDAIAREAAADLLVEGRFGLALNAPGAHVAAPLKPAYYTPPLTVECWAQVRSRAGFNILVAQQDKESSEHWEIYTYAGSGEFSAYLPGFSPAEIKSGVDIADGGWHFVGMTFDGGRVRLFVDGGLACDVPVARVREGGRAGSLFFGAYPPHGIPCDGLVDEVRISRVVRDVVAPPVEPLAADEATVGLWRFDGLADGHISDEARPQTAGGDADGDADSAARLAETLTARKAELERDAASLVPPLTYSGIMRQPEATVLYRRGDVRNPAEHIAPGGLTAARAIEGLELPLDAPEAERRLRFAQWVSRPDHPLTARVLVNRVWQQHFGRGLVETPSDFGFNGGQPTHPELLDWLAAEFIANGWRLKPLHRAIVLSAAYRQGGEHNPAAAAVDADNRLLWHFAP
jgi:mono/diheme cytochrome c family protein